MIEKQWYFDPGNPSALPDDIVPVLDEKGKQKFRGERKLVLNRYFHDYLTQWFENVLIPKKWRFVDHIPTDVQGKKHKDEIAALFAAEED